MKRVCVFCGSAAGTRPAYLEAAQSVGRAIAEHGWELVYGGGHVGLMGAVADAALAANGRVIGVIPQYLLDREIGHRSVTELRVVGSMHERKFMMYDLSDAFVILPGGFGTLDETAEIVTWAQLGYHHKPILLYNVAGFFDALLTFVDHMSDEGFIRPHHQGILVVENTLDGLIEKVAAYEPPHIDKWHEPENPLTAER